jgi:hypothetical protein
LFGFYTESFLQGSDASTATFTDPLILPRAALRGTLHLLELQDRSWFDFIGEFHYLFAATTPTYNLNSGTEFSGRLQTTHFSVNKTGVNWFFEYSLKSLGTSTFTQTSSMFLVGASLLLAW